MWKTLRASLHCLGVTLANRACLSPFCRPQRRNTSLSFSTGAGNLRYLVLIMLVCVSVCVSVFYEVWRWICVQQDRYEASEEEGKVREGDGGDKKALVYLIFLWDERDSINLTERESETR